MTPPGPQDLSLTAEVLLLAIDPGPGGLFRHDGRRFRKLLAATHRSDTGRGAGLPGAGGRARRAAVRELEDAGLLKPGQLELADRAWPSERFRQVQNCIEDGGVVESRDCELLLALAWSGVLIHRLGRHQRRVARRQLKLLIPSPEEGDVFHPPGGEPREMPAWISILGGTEYVEAGIDLFDAPALTDFGRDSSGFKPSSF